MKTAGEEEEEAPPGAPRKRKRSEEEDGAGAGMAEEVELPPDCEKGKGLLLDAEEEEEGCYEGIAEEAVEDLMRWLEAEIAGDDAAGFVTINGNEESCGPSFSCAASTVMASVDTRAGAPPPPPVPWPLPDPDAKGETAADADVTVMAADDEEEVWLAELMLACGPALDLEGV